MNPISQANTQNNDPFKQFLSNMFGENISTKLLATFKSQFTSMMHLMTASIEKAHKNREKERKSEDSSI